MEQRDYFAVLGVARDALPEQVTHRFRRLARQYHPDRNPDDPAAEARFRDISEAYEVLHDPDKRKRYEAVADNGIVVDPVEVCADLVKRVFDANLRDLKGEVPWFNGR
ncbi:MAG: J domain-containing protein [Candidatus Sungbacteria bacterium]|nr:J domain-containing protein [Candidatus Sungbacteria bacterium]